MNERQAIVEGDAFQGFVVEVVDGFLQRSPQFFASFGQANFSRAPVFCAGVLFDDSVAFKSGQNAGQVLSANQQETGQVIDAHALGSLRARQGAHDRPLLSSNTKIFERLRPFGVKGVGCLEEAEEQAVGDFNRGQVLLSAQVSHFEFLRFDTVAY